MKRWIHAASSSHPIKDKSTRKVFDDLWEWEGGDKEGFLDALDEGYHERQLPSASLADYENLMDLGEQYAKYREAKDDSFEFDVEGADRFVESIVSQYPDLNIDVDKVTSKTLPSRLKYTFTLNEYPSMKLDIEIDLAPNSIFEPSLKEKDSIIAIIEELENNSFLIDKFIRKYSGLLDTFYGEYLGIPKSKYKDYLEVTESAYSLAMWFKYLDEWKLSHEFYEKGYIDEPYGTYLQEFLEPLFESYGLISLERIRYVVCLIDPEAL